MTSTVWVDCDGVLADFASEYLRLLWMSTGRTHKLKEITSFEFSDCICSKAEDGYIWSQMVDKIPGMVVNLTEQPGAMQGLADLRRMGARVGCLTSPHIGPHWMYERTSWLLKRGFNKRDIIFASDKSVVRGDVLIDDKYENCVDWGRENPGGLAILLAQPWNKKQAAMRDLRGMRLAYARDWTAVVSEVKGWLDD